MSQANFDELNGPDDQSWSALRNWLCLLVGGWVYHAGVLSWRGQHKEVVEEIAQEAILRFLDYYQRALRGEAPPIISPKALCKTIARNHFLDRERKESLLVRSETWASNACTDEYEAIDPAEIAVDRMLLDTVIVEAAQVVVKFPRKQRRALLIDLAYLAREDDEDSLLEQTLAENGISLRDYDLPLPEGRLERTRHASLLCTAYRRLRSNVQQEYL